jgi:hypothetical protein
MNDQWTDADKAWWRLQHGTTKLVWIYERVGQKVFRRPSQTLSENLPPWVSNNRQEVNSELFGKKFTQLIIDDI